MHFGPFPNFFWWCDWKLHLVYTATHAKEDLKGGQKTRLMGDLWSLSSCTAMASDRSRWTQTSWELHQTRAPMQKKHRASSEVPVQGLKCSKYISNRQEQNGFIFLPRQENAPGWPCRACADDHKPVSATTYCQLGMIHQQLGCWG